MPNPPSRFAPYVVEAYPAFEATGGPGASDGAPDGAPEGARYEGRWFRGEETRLPSAAEAEAVVARVAGAPGTVTSAERREQSEAPPLLDDLTIPSRDVVTTHRQGVDIVQH